MSGIVVITATFAVTTIGMIIGNRAKPGQYSICGLSPLGAILIAVSISGMLAGICHEVQTNQKETEKRRELEDQNEFQKTLLANSETILREQKTTSETIIREQKMANDFIRDKLQPKILEEKAKLPAGPPDPIDATSIQGVVTDREGHPIAGIGILAFSGDRVIGESFTDAKGNYTLEVKSDGPVKLLFEHSGRVSIVSSALSPKKKHILNQMLYPLPTPAGSVGDFAGRWDVYLGGKLVRQVKLGATKADKSGEYEETTAGSVARTDYYELENNDKKLLLFKSGSMKPVEQGSVSWIDGDQFTYIMLGGSDYKFQRRK